MSSKELLDIIGVGNALVDIVAVLEEETAPRLGLHPNRAIHVSYERLSEILLALNDASMSAGGGAANIIKLAALLGLSAAFVGRVGSDDGGQPDRFAELFRAELEEAGVRLILSRGAEPTGACAVLRMPGGLSAIAACPSAALGLRSEDLPEDLIRASKLLVLDGYLLERESLVAAALRLAADSGTVVALDVGSSLIAAERAVSIAQMAASYPLILFLNEAEAESFACALTVRGLCADRSDVSESDDRYRVFLNLCGDGPFPIAVVKRGPKGALVFAAGERYEARARAAVACDETGAGDAFAAGFLAAWIRGKALGVCADIGNRLAREILGVAGTRLDADKLRRISRLLR